MNSGLRTVAVGSFVLISMMISPSARGQTFTPTGSLNLPRTAHQATLLPDGRVLVSGGFDDSFGALAPAELFDPASGTWSLAGSNVDARLEHTATLLQDGRVLVVGGVGGFYECTSNATAELYDPSTDTWSSTADLPAPAGSGAIAVRLLDGRVLVSGGGNRCGSVYSTAAILDPTTDTWSATANMTIPREFHSAILLPDGRVLVAGGATSAPFNFVASAEVFDPASDSWTSIPGMTTGRGASCNAYVQTYLAELQSGEILAAGAFTGSCSGGAFTTVNADLFNRDTMSWSATGTLNVARGVTTLTPLLDGTVLTAGGYGPTLVEEASAELFDEASGTWSLTGSLNVARNGHTATLLMNGDVLIAAGNTSTSRIGSAEIYHPASTTRSTTTGVSCAPSTISINGSAVCTATVDDTGGAGASAPTSGVSFTSNGAGAFSAPSCTLAPSAAASARCSVTYTPAAAGAHAITAAYAGDPTHAPSSGSTGLEVTAEAAGQVKGRGTIAVANGAASFHFEAERERAGGSIEGWLVYRSCRRNMTVYAKVIRQLSIVGNSASFSGDCVRRLDGGRWAACTFEVAVEDNGKPHRRRHRTGDRFTIQVNDAPPEGTAPILAGNIVVRPAP